jgi:tRNA(His) 5'-end guanylyltransferase
MSPGMFDARVFNIPKEEVVNYFVWRQQDATRNSVQMLGRHYFSHKELHKNSANDIMDKLVNEKEVYWNGLATWKKRGTCVVRGGWSDEITGGVNGSYYSFRAPHSNVVVDEECPIFSSDRPYIERLMLADSE